MSYCRWSSDNFKCDLYCYEDANGGWTTHVASNRLVVEPPEELDIGLVATPEWLESHNKRSEFVLTSERRKIGLPHDGETFNDPTLGDFKARLLELRKVGYSFPDYVLEEVDQEIADAQNRPSE